MPTKIVLSPKLPAALVDVARSLLPAEYEMQVADQGTPEFPAAMKEEHRRLHDRSREIRVFVRKAHPG